MGACLQTRSTIALCLLLAVAAACGDDGGSTPPIDAPKPDIGTLEAFRRTLLEAKSIAYSASASGVYLSTELWPKMGIWEQIKAKSRRIESERVASVVARGEAEIGFQQVSELLEIKGVDFVGPLPEGAQRTTIFAAGIATGAKEPAAARELVRFFIGVNAVGTWDELFFICTVFALLFRHFPFWQANTLQAVVFVSFLWELGYRAWGPLLTIPFALLQGFIFMKTRSLAYVVTVHLLFDAVVFLVLVHAHNPGLLDWLFLV